MAYNTNCLSCCVFTGTNYSWWEPNRKKEIKGKKQTETGRDSNPPAKKNTTTYSLESHAFSVSYKSFADTSAFFSISFLLLSLHSLSCVSMEARETKHGHTGTELNSIKNLFLNIDVVDLWSVGFGVKIQDLAPRKILLDRNACSKTYYHNIVI